MEARETQRESDKRESGHAEEQLSRVDTMVATPFCYQPVLFRLAGRSVRKDRWNLYIWACMSTTPKALKGSSQDNAISTFTQACLYYEMATEPL